MRQCTGRARRGSAGCRGQTFGGRGSGRTEEETMVHQDNPWLKGTVQCSTTPFAPVEMKTSLNDTWRQQTRFWLASLPHLNTKNMQRNHWKNWNHVTLSNGDQRIWKMEQSWEKQKKLNFSRKWETMGSAETSLKTTCTRLLGSSFGNASQCLQRPFKTGWIGRQQKPNEAQLSSCLPWKRPPKTFRTQSVPLSLHTRQLQTFFWFSKEARRHCLLTQKGSNVQMTCWSSILARWHWRSMSKRWKAPMSRTQKKEHRETACNQFVACSFIIGAWLHFPLRNSSFPHFPFLLDPVSRVPFPAGKKGSMIQSMFLVFLLLRKHGWDPIGHTCSKLAKH